MSRKIFTNVCWGYKNIQVQCHKRTWGVWVQINSPAVRGTGGTNISRFNATRKRGVRGVQIYPGSMPQGNVGCGGYKIILGKSHFMTRGRGTGGTNVSIEHLMGMGRMGYMGYKNG